MAGSTREIRLRINGKKYLEAPDGPRTTFVVGAVDMLCFAFLYAAPEHKSRIDTMINYAGKYESDTLRQKFDAYMRNVKDPENHGAAARLFIALSEWCGFDK
jgi:hypothetical protein